MKARNYDREEYEDLANEHYYTGELERPLPVGCLDIAEDLGAELPPTPHERTAEAFGREQWNPTFCSCDHFYSNDPKFHRGDCEYRQSFDEFSRARREAAKVGTR